MSDIINNRIENTGVRIAYFHAIKARGPHLGFNDLALSAQYAQKDWHGRLGGDVDADAILDRIVHRTIWVEIGEANMRE